VNCSQRPDLLREALQKRVLASISLLLNQPEVPPPRATPKRGLRSASSSPSVDRPPRSSQRSATQARSGFAHRTDRFQSARHPNAGRTRGSTGSVASSRHGEAGRAIAYFSRYIPPGVIVNEKLKFSSSMGAPVSIFEPPPESQGRTSSRWHVKGCSPTLRSGAGAGPSSKWARRAKGRESWQQNGSTRTCDVVILPIARPGSERAPLRGPFEEVADSAGGIGPVLSPNPPGVERLPRRGHVEAPLPIRAERWAR